MTNQRRTGRAANTAPKAIPRAMSAEEAFLLEESPGISTTESLSQDGQNATITHNRPGRVLMWKPSAGGRWSPREVSNSQRSQNLRLGWKIVCPDCGTNHEQSPYPPSDPNSCPANEPVAVRLCPECGHRVFDNRISAEREPSDDPNVIVDESDVATTKEGRTRIAMNWHMWAVHPQQAEMRGIRPPAWYTPPSVTPRPL